MRKYHWSEYLRVIAEEHLLRPNWRSLATYSLARDASFGLKYDGERPSRISWPVENRVGMRSAKHRERYLKSYRDHHTCDGMEYDGELLLLPTQLRPTKESVDRIGVPRSHELAFIELLVGKPENSRMAPIVLGQFDGATSRKWVSARSSYLMKIHT